MGRAGFHDPRDARERAGNRRADDRGWRRARNSREVREVSIDAAEIVRVESGTARVGVDTNDKTIALEARMEPAISFSKGCYIGQETVERATARGALKRRLMGLRIDGARVPAADARVMLAGKEVGHLTSPLRSPRLGVIALAVLHHSAWAPGTAVRSKTRTAKPPRW